MPMYAIWLNAPNASANLLCVMLPVNPVEFSPLLSRERPEDRVIQDLGGGPEPVLAII